MDARDTAAFALAGTVALTYADRTLFDAAIGVAVLGSVAREVINSSQRPVILVAPAAPDARSAAPAGPAG